MADTAAHPASKIDPTFEKNEIASSVCLCIRYILIYALSIIGVDQELINSEHMQMLLTLNDPMVFSGIAKPILTYLSSHHFLYPMVTLIASMDTIVKTLGAQSEHTIETKKWANLRYNSLYSIVCMLRQASPAWTPTEEFKQQTIDELRKLEGHDDPSWTPTEKDMKDAHEALRIKTRDVIDSLISHQITLSNTQHQPDHISDFYKSGFTSQICTYSYRVWSSILTLALMKIGCNPQLFTGLLEFKTMEHHVAIAECCMDKGRLTKTDTINDILMSIISVYLLTQDNTDLSFVRNSIEGFVTTALSPHPVHRHAVKADIALFLDECYSCSSPDCHQGDENQDDDSSALWNTQYVATATW